MPATTDLHYLEIYELVQLYRQRKVSPVEVVEQQLQRAKQLEGRLHSYARLTPETALRQAQQAGQQLAGNGGSALLGIPLGYKDLLDTAGVVTAGGMPLHAQRVPATNATVVERLEQAGAVMLGKLQMTEGAFAIHHPDIPDPVNPWGDNHWTGASSSGNGVALAAGLCYGAVGSDSGGSIRFPCAANGLSGLKPTWGRVSRHGTIEMATSLDHIGPMARSVRDVMLLFAAMAGPDPLDVTSLPDAPPQLDTLSDSFAGLTVGIDEQWLNHHVDTEIQQSLQTVIQLIQAHGGKLKRFSIPDTYAVSSQWEAHCGVQTALAHSATYPAQAGHYGPALSRLIDGGHALSGTDYQKILLAARQFTGAINHCFQDFDLILAPVQPYAAPTHEQLANLAQDADANRHLIQFTAPFNVSGHPSLSVPVGFTSGGLPLGGQFIAAKGNEAAAFQAGLALQRLTDWHRQHPPAFA